MNIHFELNKQEYFKANPNKKPAVVRKALREAFLKLPDQEKAVYKELFEMAKDFQNQKEHLKLDLGQAAEDTWGSPTSEARATLTEKSNLSAKSLTFWLNIHLLMTKYIEVVHIERANKTSLLIKTEE